MFMLTNMVYYVKQIEGTSAAPRYELEPRYDKFVVPNKIYGSLKNKAVRVWNSFVEDEGRTGVLLTGDSGGGKTLLGSIISNLALDSKLPVIFLNSIKVTPELIAYLSMFTNVVIYMDEFRKLTDYSTQDLILTFLSDKNYKRLFILTENGTYGISNYILDRPGRVKYHFTFEKIEKDIVDELCLDYGVDEPFKKDLLALHNRTTIFSFDQLQALVKEHLKYPEDTLEQLLNILNLHSLSKPDRIWVASVRQAGTPDYVSFKPDTDGMEFDKFKLDGYCVVVNVDVPNEGSKFLRADMRDLLSNVDNNITLAVDGYELDLVRSVTAPDRIKVLNSLNGRGDNNNQHLPYNSPFNF